MQRTIRDMANRALFAQEPAFPSADATYISCKMSPWTVQWGMMETRNQYEEHLHHGDKVRKISFLDIREGNHFVHWEDPLALLEVIVKSIRG